MLQHVTVCGDVVGSTYEYIYLHSHCLLDSGLSYCWSPSTLKGYSCPLVASLVTSEVCSNGDASAQLPCLRWLRFVQPTAHLVILLCMLPLIGLSPMPPTYFRVHPRSSIDLLLTCFLSLLQCLPLGCTIWYLGNTVLNYVLHKNLVRATLASSGD